MAPKVWFITGSSSGFGFDAAKQVVEGGDIAVATLRNPPKAPDLLALAEKYPDRLLILQLDVTKTETIGPAFDKAVEKFGRIDVVFNNAGYGIAGEAESTPHDVARSLFEVNFWGMVFVSHEALRVFRDVNPKTGPIGGILYQSSSSNGVANPPGTAFYSATKSGINSYTEALRGEVDPDWNITISSIGFGYFYTKSLDSSIKTPAHPAYGPHLITHKVREWASNSRVPGGVDASEAIAALYRLSKGDTKEIPALLPLGMDSVAATRAASENRQKFSDKGEEVSKSFNIRN